MKKNICVLVVFAGGLAIGLGLFWSNVAQSQSSQSMVDKIVASYKYYQDALYQNPPPICVEYMDAVYKPIGWPDVCSFYSSYMRRYPYLNGATLKSDETLAYQERWEVLPGCQQASGSHPCRFINPETIYTYTGEGGPTFWDLGTNNCRFIDAASGYFKDYGYADACTEFRLLSTPTPAPTSVSTPSLTSPILTPTITETPLPIPSPAPTGQLIVDSIFPSSLNINSENAVIIEGLGFASSALLSTDPALSFSDIQINEVDEGGTSLRAIVKVGATTSGGAYVTVSDALGRGSVWVSLLEKAASSPNISETSVESVDQDFRAGFIIKGENLGDTVDVAVRGIQATVVDFSVVSANEVTGTLYFAGGFSGVDSGERLSFVKEALAFNVAAGIFYVCNKVGCDSSKVDVPKVLSAAAATSGSSSTTSGSPFGFKIDNPFVQDIDNVVDLLGVIANFIFQLGIPVAVIIIVYSGILFLLSQGQPARIQKARNSLKYALLGLAILLIGKGFVSLIQSLLSVK